MYKYRCWSANFLLKNEPGCCAEDFALDYLLQKIKKCQEAGLLFGGEGGITGYLPVPCPPGSLRSCKNALCMDAPVPRSAGMRESGLPAFLSNPLAALRQLPLTQPFWQIKNPPEGGLFIWRRGWDSNPRRAINPCWFSRPVHSTALPPLRKSGRCVVPRKNTEKSGCVPPL